MQKFAVVLSGSGVFDGAEIHEATLTLYAIARNTLDIFNITFGQIFIPANVVKLPPSNQTFIIRERCRYKQ